MSLEQNNIQADKNAQQHHHQIMSGAGQTTSDGDRPKLMPIATHHMTNQQPGQMTWDEFKNAEPMPEGGLSNSRVVPSKRPLENPVFNALKKGKK